MKRYNKNLGLKNVGNHLYPILVEKRKMFIENMFDRKVQTSIHFLPIHNFTAYKDRNAKLPNTDYVGKRIVSLPLFSDLTDKQVDYISDTVLKTNLIIYG